jgi:hypothetical protein
MFEGCNSVIAINGVVSADDYAVPKNYQPWKKLQMLKQRN